ncbi:MAG: hypothetical protein ABIH26_09535, partial [Candidatus Eisenbacteria bacterium]
MRCGKGSGRTACQIRLLPFLLFLLPASLLAASPEPVPEDAYLSALLEIAFRERLHEDPYWHTLLHYKKGLFGLRS